MAKNYQCLNCENSADIWQFCGRCYFQLSEPQRNELEKTQGESWLAALAELDKKQANRTRHGFIDGKAFWQNFYQCPVSKDCTIRLDYTGVMTIEGIDRLVEMLQLSKDKFQ